MRAQTRMYAISSKQTNGRRDGWPDREVGRTHTHTANFQIHADVHMSVCVMTLNGTMVGGVALVSACVHACARARV